MRGVSSEPTVAKVAFCVVALTALSALWAAPGDFRSVRRTISSERGASARERELAPARYIGIDGDALVKARKLIAPNATYWVAAPPAVAQAARPLTFYWLLPRRYVDAPGDADWILAYSVDPGSFGVPTTPPIRLATGIAAAKTLR